MISTGSPRPPPPPPPHSLECIDQSHVSVWPPAGFAASCAAEVRTALYAVGARTREIHVSCKSRETYSNVHLCGTLSTCSSRFAGMFEILAGDWRIVTGVRALVGRWQIISSSCVDIDLMFQASGFTCLSRRTCSRWYSRKSISDLHKSYRVACFISITLHHINKINCFYRPVYLNSKDFEVKLFTPC